MQTFMIPGTICMSLLAGALFGVIRGIFLVVFDATAGASSCFFLSKLIGEPSSCLTSFSSAFGLNFISDCVIISEL
ncbi:Uncharacterized membrane protein At4g09580 [Linum grandiflorum]